MLLVWTVFCSYSVSTSIGYDIEVAGALHIGKDFLRRFGNELQTGPLFKTRNPPQNDSPDQLTKSKPLDTPAKDDDMYLNRLTEIEEEVNTYLFKTVENDGNFSLRSNHSKTDKPIDGMKQNVSQLTNAKEKANNDTLQATGKFNDFNRESAYIKTNEPVNFQEFCFDFKDKLLKKGVKKLKTLTYVIMNNLNSHVDIDQMLKKAKNGYITEFNKYFDYISKKNIIVPADKKIIALDMIESTNKILLNEAKKLLNDMFESNRDQKGANIHMPELMEIIQTTILEEKKFHLRFICEKLNVCRPFPGYSDQLVVLLNKIVQLTDENLNTILKHFYESITTKANFFKKIMRDNVYGKVTLKIKPVLSNVQYMRDVFSILSGVITQKFKVFESNDTQAKLKTEAIRILIDIIDCAFEANDDEVNSIEIDNTISSYRQWASGHRNDVDVITKKFINNAVELLDYGWAEETKEEIRVITDILVEGTTKNKKVYDYLFKRGFKYENY